MSKVTVDLDTFAILGAVKKASKPGLVAVAEAVAARARASTDFIDKSGQLRKSIRVEDPAPSAPFVEVRAGQYGTADDYAPHAHLVEYGHLITTADGRVLGRVEPRPFMRNAAKAVAGRAGEIVAAAMTAID